MIDFALVIRAMPTCLYLITGSKRLPAIPVCVGVNAAINAACTECDRSSLTMRTVWHKKAKQ